MNVCSLTKTFDDFNILLNDLNVCFDILAITESRIKKSSSSPINFSYITTQLNITQLKRQIVKHYFI